MNKFQTLMAAAATAGLTATGAAAQERIDGATSLETNSLGQPVEVTRQRDGDYVVGVYAPNKERVCYVEIPTNDNGALVSVGRLSNGFWRVRGTILSQNQQNNRNNCCDIDEDFRVSLLGNEISISTSEPRSCDRSRGEGSSPSTGGNDSPGLGGGAGN